MTATATAVSSTWESELSAYLAELTNVQQELLVVLGEKRKKMAALDLPGLEALQPQAAALAQRLAQCQSRRMELLEQAAREGRSATNLRDLAKSLATTAPSPLAPAWGEATARNEQLRQQSLTNWIIAQRTLLHVAEMLQILATGGRLQPTYGPGESIHASGGLFSDTA